MLRSLSKCLVIIFGAPALHAAADNTVIDHLLDRIAQQEQRFVEQLRSRRALLETYVQEMGDNPEAGELSLRDHYFLGRLDLARGLNYIPLAARSDSPKGSRLAFLRNRSAVFVPTGFAQMVLPDEDGFHRRTYQFEYIRREFLGE